MSAAIKTRYGVVVSAGAGSAGQIPVLDATGKLDPSVFPGVVGQMQRGSGVAPNSGTHKTSVAVLFTTPFATIPIVIPILRQSQICSAGLQGGIVPLSITTTGFTADINVNDDDTSDPFNINITPAFDWIAFA